ncbi:hypothetical protein CHARACLAT_026337 [Characodon lateralis]|uniref:Uncharacterized protein n=1 Tax=Characodon lateralis TaxID=208331 RepID=A0ABU7D3Y2_9TELE|nr:hypothetical protein [Characodon lateralis]
MIQCSEATVTLTENLQHQFDLKRETAAGNIVDEAGFWVIQNLKLGSSAAEGKPQDVQVGPSGSKNRLLLWRVLQNHVASSTELAHPWLQQKPLNHHSTDTTTILLWKDFI